jgi:hypothetical protein
MGVDAQARVCVCALITLIIQHATRGHIDICGFSVSTILIVVISQNCIIFGGRGAEVIRNKMFISISSATFL